MWNFRNSFAVSLDSMKPREMKTLHGQNFFSTNHHYHRNHLRKTTSFTFFRFRHVSWIFNQLFFRFFLFLICRWGRELFHVFHRQRSKSNWCDAMLKFIIILLNWQKTAMHGENWKKIGTQASSAHFLSFVFSSLNLLNEIKHRLRHWNTFTGFNVMVKLSCFSDD